MGVLGLLTVAMPALLVEGCEGRSEDAEQHARGGSDGARAGEGGESPGVGGSGGSAGGTSGTSGDAGQGGNAGEAGNAGESGMGGNAGTGGAPVDCPTDGSECPDGCFELPIRTGCDANLVRSHICTAERYDVTTIGCGVGGDGAVVYVDAPYDSASGLNPFYEIEGFRPCTQIEVDASDCRDFTDVPASRAVRFDVTNAGTEALFFAVSAQGCAPFAVERAPDWQELILDLNRPCGSTCGFTADGYATADFVRLEPGEAHSVEWDGRAAEPADVIRVCDPSGSASGWPEHHDDRCTNGPIVPVATGRYRVALLAYPATVPFLARECGTNETCSAELDVFGVYSYPDRCDELTVGAEFDVPETGDVVVPVTLGN